MAHVTARESYEYYKKKCKQFVWYTIPYQPCMYSSEIFTSQLLLWEHKNWYNSHNITDLLSENKKSCHCYHHYHHFFITMQQKQHHSEITWNVVYQKKYLQMKIFLLNEKIKHPCLKIISIYLWSRCSCLTIDECEMYF